MTLRKEKTTGKKNTAIEYIRALSMIYIVGYWHLFNYTNQFPGYFNDVTFGLAMLALSLFVFISGYLNDIKKLGNEKENARSFFRARMIRIYPPYLAALCTFRWLHLADTWTLLKSGLCLSMFWTPAAPTLWFITMMMLFYFITPWLKAQAMQPFHFTIAVLCFCSILYGYGQLTQTLDLRVLRYAPIYACGLFIGSNPPHRLQLPLWIPLIALPPTFILGSRSFFYHSDSSIDLTPCLLAASLIVFLFFMRTLQNSSTPRLIHILSYASYFMYLFHRPLFAVFVRSWFPAHGIKQLLYLGGCCLPIIVVISYAGQYLYDKTVHFLTARSISTHD